MSNRQRIEAVLSMEETAIKNYTERAQQAEEVGEIGIKQCLEDMISDETEHRDEVLMLLRTWKD